MPKSHQPLISTLPNIAIHLESSSSAVQNPKKILSENPKQPTLIPHPRLDTQKSNLSAIIKPIQTRQATITLEFLSLPHPKSPPLPLQDPKPTTTQEQTKQSKPTVEQPNPSDSTSASTKPPPILVKCHPLSIFCHRVPDPHHSYYVAKDPHEDSTRAYFIWLPRKGKGRMCLVPKAKTSELAREETKGRVLFCLAQEAQKKDLVCYVWFRKKKRIKWYKKLQVAGQNKKEEEQGSCLWPLIQMVPQDGRLGQKQEQNNVL
jgi:hypothetical protein